VTPPALTAISVVIAVIACDAWVFTDARNRDAQGRSVVASVGQLTISTPEQWGLGCLVLWIFVFPLYLTARRAT
jgi:putative flippase GtrA